MSKYSVWILIFGAAVILFFSWSFMWPKVRDNNPFLKEKVSVVGTYGDCTNPDKSRPETGECLRQLAKTAMHQYTVAELESALGEVTDFHELLWCHEFMHYAGWELYDRKKNISDAFLEASGKCDSGMFHGVVEEYIIKSETGGDPESFAKTVAPSACEGDVASNHLVPGAKNICYHGMGHAFMVLTDNALDKSLRFCDYLAGDSGGRGCYGGALMENLQSKQVGRTSVGHASEFSFNTGNPDFPCNSLDSKHKNACYTYRGVQNLNDSKGDIKQAFVGCFEVDPAYRNVCFWGVGNNIPGPHWSSRTAGEKCADAFEVSPMAYTQCILGGMSFLIQLNRGDAFAAVEYCDTIKESYKNICYWTAGDHLHNWITSEDDIVVKCSAFNDMSARELCLHHGNSPL